MILWHLGTTALQHNGTMALWHYGTRALGQNKKKSVKSAVLPTSLMSFFQSAANSAAMGGAYRAVYLAQGGTQVGPFSQVRSGIYIYALLASKGLYKVMTHETLVLRWYHMQSLLVSR